ncbi:hypothetical protein GVN18_36045 [Pseudomonas sp. ODNR1LW]|nr:hypothetical protein [Pseudomonas sp. ODNR1LW]
MSWRALSPVGWLAAALAVVIVLALAAATWNRLWSWLPFSAEAQLDDAKTELATTRSDATARGLEAQGNAEQVARTEAYGDIRIRVEAETARSIIQAQEAPDATTPLSAERADRLRDHDRRLCDLSPRSCPAAAPDAP